MALQEPSEGRVRNRDNWWQSAWDDVRETASAAVRDPRGFLGDVGSYTGNDRLGRTGAVVGGPSASGTPWSPWNPTGSPRALARWGNRNMGKGVSTDPDTQWSPWNPTGSPRALLSDLWFLDKPDGSRRGLFGFGRSGAGPDVQAAEAAGPSFPWMDGGIAEPSVDPGLGAMDAYIAQLDRRASDIESQYQADKAALQGMFQLSETPEEKAALAYQLQDLENQRSAAVGVIANAFDQAISSAGQTADRMSGQAAQAGANVQGIYDRAQAGAEAGIAGAHDNFRNTGVGLGDAEPASGDATDFIPLIAGSGAAQAALAQNLGNIGAQDAAWLQGSLGGEAAARKGDAARLAAQMQAAATIAQQQQVQDRIASERMAMIDAMMRLEDRHRGRQYDLEDRRLDVEGAQAQQEQGPQRPDPYKDPVGFNMFWTEMFTGSDAGDPAIGMQRVANAKAGAYGPEVKQLAEALYPTEE